MTDATLNKYRKVNYDDKGKPTSVLLNLKNKKLREAYFKALEELESIEAFEKIKKIKNDPNNTWSDFFEVSNKILASQKANVLNKAK